MSVLNENISAEPVIRLDPQTSQFGPLNKADTEVIHEYIHSKLKSKKEKGP